MSDVSHSTNLNLGNSSGSTSCPFCSERNVANAQLCKHCGENMTSSIESRSPRPWVRYWARSVDFLVYNIVPIMLMMGATFFMMNVAKPGVDKYQGMEALVMAGMVMLVACLLIVLICFLGGWILMEAFCLSTFGTTLGKWLLKVHIRNADGSRLSFKQGCVRGCKIWFRGMGLFIPIVGLVTHVMAFNRLKNHQITSWDEDDSLVVTHSTIGPARIAVVVGIFLAQNVISGILQLMSMSHRFPNPH